MATKTTTSKKQAAKISQEHMTLKRERGESFMNVYANNASLTFTLFDFMITLGIVTSVNQENKQVVVEDLVAVRMSPEHALSLSEILNTHIGLYEKSFGPIRRGPDATGS